MKIRILCGRSIDWQQMFLCFFIFSKYYYIVSVRVNIEGMLKTMNNSYKNFNCLLERTISSSFFYPHPAIKTFWEWIVSVCTCYGAILYAQTLLVAAREEKIMLRRTERFCVIRTNAVYRLFRALLLNYVQYKYLTMFSFGKIENDVGGKNRAVRWQKQ